MIRYGLDFRIEVNKYKRITPATAESACLTLKRQAETTGSQPILFAPVVSDRTGEIATKHGVSWMDYVGNCRLVFPAHGIYVNRRGTENPYGKLPQQCKTTPASNTSPWDTRLDKSIAPIQNPLLIPTCVSGTTACRCTLYTL